MPKAHSNHEGRAFGGGDVRRDWEREGKKSLSFPSPPQKKKKKKKIFETLVQGLEGDEFTQ